MPVEGHPTDPGTEYLDIPEIEAGTYQNLCTILDEYRELADTCLLVLHLEVRVHCFYYLMPVAKQVSGNYMNYISLWSAKSCTGLIAIVALCYYI